MKTLLITGATDGIGLETAKRLAAAGHAVLLHGRSAAKLDHAAEAVAAVGGGGAVERFVADLARLDAVDALAEAIRGRGRPLDVLINNAGVLKAPEAITAEGLDLRFMVNTIAPCRLTVRLAPLLGTLGRVVNVASAAQAPVDLAALSGGARLADMPAYAQSKLALIMWTREMAAAFGAEGPALIAVNPGSLLASKMVRDGFGIAGSDLGKGADILMAAALDAAFAEKSGAYFDNDAGRFAPPHADALDAAKTAAVAEAVKRLAGV